MSEPILALPSSTEDLASLVKSAAADKAIVVLILDVGGDGGREVHTLNADHRAIANCIDELAQMLVTDIDEARDRDGDAGGD